MSGQESDRALVAAARGGDKDAFARLLARHRPLLLALCRRALGDPDLAEDAVQEASLQALLSLERLRRADRFGPWLAGIGLNICRRWLRERPRDVWSWEALLGGRQVIEPLDPRAGPDELVEVADVVVRVRRAVAKLPPGQRAAVLLSYLAGLTQAETAAQLGIEVGAVKTRLHKARQTLRRRLWTDWQEDAMTTEGVTQWVEVRIADVRRQPAAEDRPAAHVVILEEIGGASRLLAIWVGPFEGYSIALQVEEVEVARPLTYAFTASLLAALGGRLREVRVTRLAEQTFYAAAVVDGRTGRRTIDARPSDALNLALITGAPIRVEAAVLDAVSFSAETRQEKAAEVAGWLGPAEIVEDMRQAWFTRLGPGQCPPLSPSP